MPRDRRAQAPGARRSHPLALELRHPLALELRHPLALELRHPLALELRHALALELRRLLLSRRSIEFDLVPRQEVILYGPDQVTMPVIARTLRSSFRARRRGPVPVYESWNRRDCVVWTGWARRRTDAPAALSATVVCGEARGDMSARTQAAPSFAEPQRDEDVWRESRGGRRWFSRRAPAWARLALVAVVAVGAFVAGMLSLRPPDPRPAGAPADVFSAGRAMRDLEVIAREPHPAGSPAMAKVADYIRRELVRAGVTAREQVVRGGPALTLHNVVARIPGRDSTGAVLFEAHSDSVSSGPGAADNGSGAAVQLEMARALAAGPRPRNDVILLFDDGEEGDAAARLAPFAGSYAFAANHPWMQRVRLVVGMDTAAWRPVHVVQLSAHDGALVRGYAAGAESPVAFGFAAGLTDSESFTTPFRDQGLPAIELEDDSKFVFKHTARDTVDRVKAPYVQQMGDQTLGLARAYGSTNLADASAPDRVFHTLPVIGVIHYPAAWSLPLAALAVAGSAAVVFGAIRRGRVRGRRVLGGVALALALLAGTALLAAAAAALYGSLYPNPNPDIDAYVLDSSGPFAIAAGAVVAALFALAYRTLGRWIGHAELALGFLGLWLTFAFLFAVAVPDAAYLFEWPLLIACVAWLVALRFRSPGLIVLLPAAVAVLLAAPMLLIGFYADGVANLPVQALVAGLIAGLIAPAVVAAPRHLFTADNAPRPIRSR